MNQIIKTVYLNKQDELVIIDQRLLPAEEKEIKLTDKQIVWDAIKTLAVRGAPAIGVAAAYGTYISIRQLDGNRDISVIKKDCMEIIDYLATSRPTAYNLFYALDRMKVIVQNATEFKTLLSELRKSAVQLHEEDIEKSDRMGEFGAQVVPQGARILTHCNAGGLATGGNGTALAVIYAAHNKGKDIKVWVDETRPLLQGARLTAWELNQAGIPHQVICDNMSGMVMRRGEIDMIVVGADRVAANGDFANKIGTYSVAVLAHYHEIPFYIAVPLTTFDLNIKDGTQIPIEERDADEVIRFRGVQTAPLDSDVFNPAFDVTPHSLLTGIITEYGIIYPPFEQNIKEIIGKNYGRVI